MSVSALDIVQIDASEVDDVIILMVCIKSYNITFFPLPRIDWDGS